MNKRGFKKKNITTVKTTSGINMWNRAKNLTTHDIDTHWSLTKKPFGSDGDKSPETVGLPCGVGIFCLWPLRLQWKDMLWCSSTKNPLDVKINLSPSASLQYNMKDIATPVKPQKIKQMDFKSNPGSYVNVYVQMRSMTGKQKQFISKKKHADRWS